MGGAAAAALLWVEQQQLAWVGEQPPPWVEARRRPAGGLQQLRRAPAACDNIACHHPSLSRSYPLLISIPSSGPLLPLCVRSIASIIPVLEQVLKTQRPLLIISEDVESGG